MLSALCREGGTGGGLERGFWSRLVGRFAGTGRNGSSRQELREDHANRPLTISLRDQKLFTMQVRERCEITCTRGTVWVTPRDRRCDYILKSGESLVLRRENKILISGSAEENSSIEVVYK